MYSQTDLLSYETIDDDVRRIFRAYCDTSLIGFAEAASKRDNVLEPKTYWSSVLKFRREYLTPYDRPDLLRRSGLPAQPEPDPAAPLPSAEDLEFGLGFLYWFDARAEYWSAGTRGKQLTRILATPDRLHRLLKQARKIQSRIHSTQAHSSIDGAERADAPLETIVVIDELDSGTFSDE